MPLLEDCIINSCKGKAHVSHESGKKWSQCAGCGVVQENGVVTAPPRGASAELKRTLGLNPESKAHPKKKKKTEE